MTINNLEKQVVQGFKSSLPALNPDPKLSGSRQQPTFTMAIPSKTSKASTHRCLTDRFKALNTVKNRFNDEETRSWSVCFFARYRECEWGSKTVMLEKYPESNLHRQPKQSFRGLNRSRGHVSAVYSVDNVRSYQRAKRCRIGQR
jgi:hypothetical protein